MTTCGYFAVLLPGSGSVEKVITRSPEGDVVISNLFYIKARGSRRCARDD
jgi:hypothetical protein